MYGSMSERNYEAMVRDGINAARNGNRRLAWSLLTQSAQMNSLDARPWLWLTETTDDLKEKCEYLEHAVAIDPQNAATRRALEILREQLAPGSPAAPANTGATRAQGDDVIVQPAEEPITARTRQAFLCPKCGGHITFNLKANQLLCLYCGYAPESGEERSAADDERPMLDYLPTESGHRWAASQQQLLCQRCGAGSLWPPGQKALQCPYCGSQQMIQSAETELLIDPQAIAIMQIDEAEASRRVKNWFGRGWFAPDDLTKAAERHLLHPVYYPFWTFDGILMLHWSCEVNEGNSRYQNWISRTGVESEIFNDVLVPGLKRLSLRDLRKLGPYNLLDVVEFKPEYLAGWPAFTYDQPLAKASLLAREQVVQAVRRNLSERVHPGQQKRNLQTGGLDWSDMTFKNVLLPLWIGTYHYQGKEYKVYVNGQTGKVTGEKPRDPLKATLIGLSALLVILVALTFAGLIGLQMGWLKLP